MFLAAEKVGRIGFGIEYEPAYVDVAVNRWQRWTKLEATLDGDGRTYANIAKIRLDKSEEHRSRAKISETARSNPKHATRSSKTVLSGRKREERHD